MSFAQPLEAALLLSFFAAPLGAFLIFRRLSFFGDALGHSSIAGVAVVVMLGKDAPIFLSMGALVSVLITAQLLQLLERRFKLSPDLAMTLSYSGMFAVGVLILSKSDLDLEHILFGDIWNVTRPMLVFLRIWNLVVWGFLILLWKPLWVSVMDPHFARSLGIRFAWMDFIFLFLTSVSVVGLIQSVGAVLVTSYLVFPAAASLAWARSLPMFAVQSVLFAVASSLIGIFSSIRLELSAGPSIAFAGFLLVILSHACALFFRRWRRVLS